jgi:hypothetical protein
VQLFDALEVVLQLPPARAVGINEQVETMTVEELEGFFAGAALRMIVSLNG